MSLDRPRSMRTTAWSVETVARPRPGKCFMVGSVPPCPSPFAKAAASLATVKRLVEKARCCCSMKSAGPAGTSATGARSRLIPIACNAAPVFAPDVWETDAGNVPSSAAERFGGAHGMRRTTPPSWSVAMISGGRPPACAAAWSAAVSRATCAFETTLFENRITPPTCPARTRASSGAFARVPFIATTSRWPTSCGSVGAAARAAGVAPPRQSAAAMPTPIRTPSRGFDPMPPT